jgi:transposase
MNPALIELPGCGPLTAAKLLAETAGAERFASEAQLARIPGVAPIPVSSGRSDRHRLDRGGNRQLNRAFHRIAFTQKRMSHEPACRYLATKESEGKTPKEALRCLKRQLVRTVLSLLRPPPDETDFLAIRKRIFSSGQSRLGVGLAIGATYRR